MSTINSDFKVKHGLTVKENTTLLGTSNALGTVTSGHWNGSPVPLQHGGTGADLSSATGYFVLNAGTLTTSPTIPASAVMGTLTNTTSVMVTDGNIGSATYTSSTTSANQVIDAVSPSTASAIKYTIVASFGNNRQVCEMLVTHDGTTPVSVEYGNVATGVTLASYDTELVAGNIHLLATPVNSTTTFKIIRVTVNT